MIMFLLVVKIFHNLFMPMVLLSYEVFFTYDRNRTSFVCEMSLIYYGPDPQLVYISKVPSAVLIYTSRGSNPIFFTINING